MPDIPADMKLPDDQFALPYNFGGLLPEHSDFEPSQVVILPIPYEQTTTYGTGTKDGPRALITASRNLELYDEELDYEAYQVGIHTLRELAPEASGPAAMLDRIAAVTREEVDSRDLGAPASTPSGLVSRISLAGTRAKRSISCVNCCDICRRTTETLRRSFRRETIPGGWIPS